MRSEMTLLSVRPQDSLVPESGSNVCDFTRPTTAVGWLAQSLHTRSQKLSPRIRIGATRSYSPSAHLYSIARLRPSTKPASLSLRCECSHLVAERIWRSGEEEANHRHADRCALTDSAHAAAVPPRRMMSSRRD